MTESRGITPIINPIWRELKLIDGPVRWLYWAVGLAGIWYYQQGDLGVGAILGIVLYLGINLALIPLFPRLNPNHQGALAAMLAVVDLLFVSFIIYHTGGLVSQFFLLYCLLVFKAAIYYPYVHAIFLVPFLIFPLYMATLFLDTRTLVFLTEQPFVPRYILLFAVILTGLYTAWHLDSRHQQTRVLLEQLESEHRHTDERRRELRAVLDSIGDGVIVVDRDLLLLMINPIAAQVFGLEHPPEKDGHLSDLLDSSKPDEPAL